MRLSFLFQQTDQRILIEGGYKLNAIIKNVFIWDRVAGIFICLFLTMACSESASETLLRANNIETDLFGSSDHKDVDPKIAKSGS